MIKANTVYTKETLNDFVSFALKKNKTFIIIYVCAFIILLASIFMFIMGDIFYGVMYLFFALFFSSYQLILSVLTRKKVAMSIGCYDEFEFGEDKFKIISYSQKGEEKSTITKKYDEIFKTYQNKDYFYIFIDKINAFIITKKDFKELEKFDELISFVNSKNAKKETPDMFKS